MSNERDKEKHGKRILGDEHAIRRQVKILKEHKHIKSEYFPNLTQPHRFAKHHAMNCGNPKCVLCGNPRKMFKEKTIQEKRFEQNKLYDET
jgi:hypothetical protein